MSLTRFAAAAAAAAAIILSAPIAQQAFTAIADQSPDHLRTLVIGTTAVPIGAMLLAALVRIREQRLVRYSAVALGLATGGAYVLRSGLSFAESFHFIEYGLLAILWYGVWRAREDGSALLLPLLAGLLAGTADEWFQWFIPIRAGEARDIAINGLAIACGLLCAIGLDPPRRLTLAVRRESVRDVTGWAAVALCAFALFFQSAHLGYDIVDGEIGSFRSGYSSADLGAAHRDRAERWRHDPPVRLRRLSREDQYFAEGLWHVRRRNEAWSEGDLFAAWRENRILEKFYTPILDAPSYVSATGHRWPAEQRETAASHAAADRRPYTSDANPLPMYAWPRPIFWAGPMLGIAALAAACLRFSSRAKNSVARHSLASVD